MSLAANVANATVGDAATSANIVAGASQENAATNAAWGIGNYAVAGAKGTFTETPRVRFASGFLKCQRSPEPDPHESASFFRR